MKAVMPSKLSTMAEVGDVLELGKFLRPGSSAPDKEPFLAFYKKEHPSQIVCLRNGTRALVFCPLSAAVHEQYGIYLIYAIDPKTHRKVKDGRFVFFPDTDQETVIEKGEFPPGLKIKVLTEGIL